MLKYRDKCLETFRLSILLDSLKGCWIWKGPKTIKGYGKIRYYTTGLEWQHDGAHNLSYELFREPIPLSMKVGHYCNNPSCVNPMHLRLIPRDKNYKLNPNAKPVKHANSIHEEQYESMLLFLSTQGNYPQT